MSVIGSSMGGKARNVSETRIIAVSTQPSNQPAARPIGIPIASASATQARLASSVVRAPWSRRE